MFKIFPILNIFDLDFGEFGKKSSIIANWERWSETVDVKLPGIMFELKVTLQKMLLIKVEGELEILVGSNMREVGKLDKSVSTKLLTVSDVSYCSKYMLKSPRKKNFKFLLLSISNNDSIIFVKLFTYRDGCL